MYWYDNISCLRQYCRIHGPYSGIHSYLHISERVHAEVFRVWQAVVYTNKNMAGGGGMKSKHRNSGFSIYIRICSQVTSNRQSNNVSWRKRKQYSKPSIIRINSDAGSSELTDNPD
jgi:hypothetical protein